MPPVKVVIIIVAVVAFCRNQKLKTKITIRHASHATYCYHEKCHKTTTLIANT